MGFVRSVFARIRAACQSFSDTSRREARAESDPLNVYRSTHSDAESPATASRKYSPPQMRKLNPEQAKLILIGHAMTGDEGANELLGLVFPEQGKPIITESGARNA